MEADSVEPELDYSENQMDSREVYDLPKEVKQALWQEYQQTLGAPQDFDQELRTQRHRQKREEYKFKNFDSERDLVDGAEVQPDDIDVSIVTEDDIVVAGEIEEMNHLVSHDFLLKRRKAV